MTPNAPALLVGNRRGWLWIVPSCPLCGAEHIHGGGRGNDPREHLSHRAAHCGALSGYVLTDADPERTFEMMHREESPAP